MKITKRTFGTLADGTAVSCWTMENAHGLRAELLDYGAAIRSIQVPDRTGRLVDVVLGYDDLAGYTGNPSFYGATIAGSATVSARGIELNGKAYGCQKNNGDNHLHGGLRGFDKYVWQGEAEADGVRFTRVSPDGEEGYPGTLTVSVKFSWQGDGLMLHYTAQCDQDTILNLTNHSYFNLDGEGTVQEQLLKIHADRYTPNDAGCLPTGELAPVAGTAMDFRSFKAIGKDADSDEPCVKPFRGYDVNSAWTEAFRRRSEVIKSGIVMHVTSLTSPACSSLRQPYERAYWQKRTAIRPPLRVLP